MERAKGTDLATLFKESDEDVYARLLPVVHEEIARVVSSQEDSPPKNNLLVVHGGVIRVLLRDIFEVGGKEKIKVVSCDELGGGAEARPPFLTLHCANKIPRPQWNASVSRVDVAISKAETGSSTTTSTSPSPIMDKNTVVVEGEAYTWTCKLAGPIGDVSYLPEDLRVKRSDV